MGLSISLPAAALEEDVMIVLYADKIQSRDNIRSLYRRRRRVLSHNEKNKKTKKQKERSETEPDET